jgi:hypothetical protein
MLEAMGEADYWIVPVGRAEDIPSVTTLRLWLERDSWAFFAGSSSRSRVKPGDWFAFYCAGAGVVAKAQVADNPGRLARSDEWPTAIRRAKSAFIVRLRAIEWLARPVRVDADLRSTLDAFRSKKSRHWGWIVLKLRRVTEADFRRLTRT